jgi:hypothetical protein
LSRGQQITLSFLTRLPAFGIAPVVEAGNHHNPVLLNLENDPIREAPYSRPPPVAVNDRKTKWVFGDGFHRRSDCQGELLAKLRSYAVVEARASLASAFASGSQTTGSVTAS